MSNPEGNDPNAAGGAAAESGAEAPAVNNGPEYLGFSQGSNAFAGLSGTATSTVGGPTNGLTELKKLRQWEIQTRDFLGKVASSDDDLSRPLVDAMCRLLPPVLATMPEPTPRQYAALANTLLVRSDQRVLELFTNTEAMEADPSAETAERIELTLRRITSDIMNLLAVTCRLGVSARQRAFDRLGQQAAEDSP